MTIPQFKYLIQQGGLLDSPDREVNILYTGSYIQAIAVRISGENLTQLQQATTVVLRAPEVGSTLNISLESSQVPIRTVNREQVGNYYMYTIVEQDQQPVMTVVPSPSGTPSLENYFTEVIILPSSAGGVFQGSEYDVLLNNSMNNRLSTYIQVSDRGEGQVNPVNLPSILIDNAVPANIQDSSYSDTGWASSRYNGSTTQGSTFGGIEPVLNGNTFQGAVFPIGLSQEDIVAAVSQGITYVDYFFTGKSTFPTFIAQETALGLYTNLSISQSYLDLKVLIGSGITYHPKEGDIIALSISTLGTITDEYMKVTSFENTGGTAGRIYVERGWGGTPLYAQSPDTPIFLITPIQIFELEKSKPQGIQKSKLYVKDSGDVLLINSLGYIITGSTI